MKRFAWIWMLSTFFLVGCMLQSYNFEQGYTEVRKIDSRYGTVFHIEKLGGTMVPLEKIDPMVADVRALQDKVNRSQATEDKETLLLFVQARIHMLESERSFQEAVKFGEKGIVSDGFRCSESPTVEAASKLYQHSLQESGRAQNLLDAILQEPKTRDFIGINENKPQFYDSPNRALMLEVQGAEELLEKCRQETRQQPRGDGNSTEA